MVSHDVRRLDPPLRLTRRGRAAVLVLLVLAASLASAVLFTTASRADNTPGGPAPTIVVQRGDTLWGIAARALPRRNNQDAVAELRDLNHLSGYDVKPGDVLTLPRGR
jgi:Tfp pilus assembly protein FimV